MKKLLILLLISTSANALEEGDYGYGYTYHGYNSLEQQQEAEHNEYLMQQTNRNIVDNAVNQRLNGGQPPQEFREFDYSNPNIYGQE
tara:strand:+ start:244 stop:504 length:261 start_codon:yes stop_codon:yes gene_type:complete